MASVALLGAHWALGGYVCTSEGWYFSKKEWYQCNQLYKFFLPRLFHLQEEIVASLLSDYCGMTVHTKFIVFHLQNTPNDLQLLSDAPAHHIFCLLGPVDPAQNTLPEVYCVLQVRACKARYNKLWKRTCHQLDLHPC